MKRLLLSLILSCLLALTGCLSPTADPKTPAESSSTGDDYPIAEAFITDYVYVEAFVEGGFIGHRSGYEWLSDDYVFVEMESLNGTVCLHDFLEIHYSTGYGNLTEKEERHAGTDIVTRYHIRGATVEQAIVDEKPVIYLYPETETEVTVRIDLKGAFTVTAPPYHDGWTITASPDGTLTDGEGSTYPYLFWEGVTSALLPMDEGFCVRGTDTKDFLLDVLPRLGLIETEYTEFIDYWLPRMESSPYNVITFQTDAYEALAPLTVSPAPDAVLRVFMSFYPSETPVELPAQELLPFVRQGFTVVEWGGREQRPTP